MNSQNYFDKRNNNIGKSLNFNYKYINEIKNME